MVTSLMTRMVVMTVCVDMARSSVPTISVVSAYILILFSFYSKIFPFVHQHYHYHLYLGPGSVAQSVEHPEM